MGKTAIRDGMRHALDRGWMLPPIPQDAAYHLMADQRTLLGIPNCLNVLSNLPFALVGALGLYRLFGRTSIRSRHWERGPYAALFAGTALTAAGSAYYHLDPGNWRLVWDRLPMTLGFMGLLAGVLAERFGGRVGRVVLGPLLLLGVGSVAFWYRSELRGEGDLRPYLFVQYGSLLVVLLLVLGHPLAHPSRRYLLAALGTYALAKVFEAADAPVFAAGHIVSGHTLKHFTAAGAVGWVVAMFGRRVALAPPRRAG
jgi:hypothetical protein